ATGAGRRGPARFPLSIDCPPCCSARPFAGAYSMLAVAARTSRWRRIVNALLVLVLPAVLIAAHLLHWDDQLRLYWREQSVDAMQRTASIWLPDYVLALETTLAGLAKDEPSGMTWNKLSGT